MKSKFEEYVEMIINKDDLENGIHPEFKKIIESIIIKLKDAVQKDPSKNEYKITIPRDKLFDNVKDAMGIQRIIRNTFIKAGEGWRECYAQAQNDPNVIDFYLKK